MKDYVEAGTLGGEATLKAHGREHFSRIGALGGAKNREKGREYFSEIGKKGAAAKKARRLERE